MRLILWVLTLTACLGVIRASLASDRDIALSSGGGGGGVDPPISGPAAAPANPTNTPTLGANGPVVVLLTATAEHPERTHPRIAVIRLGTEILGVTRLQPGAPAVLTVPSVDGLQLDVLGTDALGVPVTVGSVVRVVAP